MARTYDNNGNQLTGYAWYWTHIWDYNNRLYQSVFSYNTRSTSTYAYDHTGQRVKLNDGTNITTYPNQYYNIKSQPSPSPSASPTPTPNITKHIFANGKTIATIEGFSTNSTTNIYIAHNDHLGGTSIVSDKNGRLEQTLDYYPFGAIRTNLSGENSFNEQRKFTGHEYDGATNLTYMGARYYPGTKARFLSQDPAFLAVGNEGELQSKTKLKQVAYLSNPQFLNSYSYTANNPLLFKDKNGEFIFLAAPIVAYAPVWVPIAITGVAAVGAGVQSWFMGQAIGQAMGGDYQGANQSLEAVQTTGAMVGAGAAGLMEAGALMSPAINSSSNNKTLPNNTIVCRGGQCKSENFAKPGEVKNGLLSGSSVTASPNASVEELTKNFPQNQFGQTSLDKIRALGGDVVPSVKSGNPYHADLSGITPRQAESLFTPTKLNPNKIK